jgi:CheY-like chemotaxis protein
MTQGGDGNGRARRELRRVLVVDDDLEMVTALREVLEKEGYELRVVGDGLSALEQLRRDGVDAVVLDVLIPGIEGEKLCGFIRTDARHRTTPVVLCSSLGPHELALLPQVNADAYVAKGAPHPTAADILFALRRLAEPADQGEAEDLLLGYARLGTRRPLGRLIARLRTYQDILGVLTEAVLEVDLGGRVAYLNRAALVLLGRSEREVLGRPLAEALGAPHGSPIEGAVARFGASGQGEAKLIQRVSGLDREVTLIGRYEGGRRRGTLLIVRSRPDHDPAARPVAVAAPSRADGRNR